MGRGQQKLAPKYFSLTLRSSYFEVMLYNSFFFLGFKMAYSSLGLDSSAMWGHVPNFCSHSS